MGSYDKSSARTTTTADPRPQQRRRVHGGSPSHPPMAFDVGPVAAPASPAKAAKAGRPAGVRTWRSTVVGVSLGLGLVLALSMKWLMGYQIDSAEERRVQQKAARAAAARCYEQASPAAVNACLKDVEARSLPTP